MKIGLRNSSWTKPMSLWREIKEIKSSTKELRQFGYTLGIVCAVLVAFLWFRGRGVSLPFLEASTFFLFFALAFPGVLKPFQKVWMSLALMIGWTMSYVILTTVFYLVFMPLALILKFSGKDLLSLKLSKTDTSYWRGHAARDKTSCERQF
jgi:Saxitoxin biosynthesis operon protein SxtJ